MKNVNYSFSSVRNNLAGKPQLGLLPMQLASIGRNGWGTVFTLKGIFRVTTNSSGTLTFTQVRKQRGGK